MDWCLITTKSGHLFPKSWDDYIVDKQVAAQIKKLNPEMVLLVSNQSGVGDRTQPNKFMTKANFEKRINSIMSELQQLTGVPVYGTYCASGDKNNPCRKPNPGMCQQMMDKYCPGVAKEDMLMIGDASGLKGDWADTDKRCALNFGIDYMDVDEFAHRPHRDDKFKDIEESLTIKEYIEITDNMKDLKEAIIKGSSERGLVEFLTEAQNKKEFMIIKPEFCHLKNEILEFLKQHKIIVVRELRKTLSLSEAKKLYKPHAQEDFYNDLCEYMASGDSIGFVLCNYGGEDMLKLKDEIRKKWGKDEMRNAIHSSDSGLNVHRESQIYFGTPKV